MSRITKKTMISMLHDNGIAIDNYYAELKTVIGLEDDYSVWATDKLVDALTKLEVEAALLEFGIMKDHYDELESPNFPPIRM